MYYVYKFDITETEHWTVNEASLILLRMCVVGCVNKTCFHRLNCLASYICLSHLCSNFAQNAFTYCTPHQLCLYKNLLNIVLKVTIYECSITVFQ